MIPGAVAVPAASDEDFKGNKYQRKIAASSVYSGATSYKNSSSSSNESASNKSSSSLFGTFVNNEVVASTFTSLENLSRVLFLMLLLLIIARTHPKDNKCQMPRRKKKLRCKNLSMSHPYLHHWKTLNQLLYLMLFLILLLVLIA